MGNGQRNRSTELDTTQISIQDHNYKAIPSRESVSYSCAYSIRKQPDNCTPHYLCISCNRQCFDGGQCKIIKCICGAIQKRDEQNRVTELNYYPESQFQDNFDILQSRFLGECSELQSLSLGVFLDSLPEDLMNGHSPDFQTITELVLTKYFEIRLRYITEGDYISFEGCHIKVLASYPLQGFVTRNTRIHCTQTISCRPLRKIRLVPIAPHVINSSVLDSVIVPYFSELARHVHEEQKLVIRGLECVVASALPSDGIVTADTEIFFEPDPLNPIKRISLIPFSEDLPGCMRAMDQKQLSKSVLDQFLMPYLKGWTRVIYQGKEVAIDGVGFKAQSVSPSYGFITSSTLVVYDGKRVSRAEQERQHRRSQRNRSRRNRTLHIDNSIQEVNTTMVIRELMNVLENFRVLQEGASEVIISQLPSFSLTRLPESADQCRCLICMNDFELEEQVKALPCSNV